MKFGKNLIRVVELSNPEWGQYWINYKFLKKKIHEIVENQGGVKADGTSDVVTLKNSQKEVEFFILIQKELKKTCDFFSKSEQEYLIRWERISESYKMLKDGPYNEVFFNNDSSTYNPSKFHDKNTWTRLLIACVRLYRDVLFLENFAIMNYCGFSKILKKHDKLTGYKTREAYMRKIISTKNITRYPTILNLIKVSEKLFRDIQNMESVMPLDDEERLFIDALRDLNYQASRMQEIENREVEINNNLNSGNNSGNEMSEAEKNEKNEKTEKNIINEISLSNENISSSTTTSTTESTCPIALALSNEVSEGLDAATSKAIEVAHRLSNSTANQSLNMALSTLEDVGKIQLSLSSNLDTSEHSIETKNKKETEDDSDDAKNEDYSLNDREESLKKKARIEA